MPEVNENEVYNFADLSQQENMILRGYTVGKSKKGRQYCMLYVSCPFDKAQIGQNDDYCRYGEWVDTLFLPEGQISDIKENMVGSIIQTIYKHGSSGPRLTKVNFIDPATGELLN